ncbi:MAG TPA: PadR family transcriptional regulator [Myxococcales bacterium]|nr:PadR family transcriptional regulator [Myxococcales bacterium]
MARSHTAELMQGSLDLMVLKALSFGPQHGYGVARWIAEVTGDVLSVEEGSLYPALHRLEERRAVESYWGVSENNRRARYYELSARGRQQLRADAASWQRFAAAVARVLAAPEPAL